MSTTEESVTPDNDSNDETNIIRPDELKRIMSESSSMTTVLDKLKETIDTNNSVFSKIGDEFRASTQAAFDRIKVSFDIPPQTIYPFMERYVDTAPLPTNLDSVKFLNTDIFSPPYYSHEERLADAIEENNKLQRQILEELKIQRLSPTTTSAATSSQSVNIHNLTPSTKSKRGRSSYTDDEKLESVKFWDSLDPNRHSMTLPEYLEAKFGVENGVLVVAESTFHSWRKYLKVKGLY